jgi:UDP-N-acetylglucosamine 2-epimerase (non-hydrolysing)
MAHRIVVEVAAARPNFMKVAPVHDALRRNSGLEPVLVHAGQHYDPTMSDVFFRDLGLEDPAILLEIGSGTHAEQTARVLTRLEPQLVSLAPAVVVVVGDVNATLGAALCAAKLQIPVVHVEAGLRSFDRAMPEEINRVMTDAISDLLLAPSDDAVLNLVNEGHPDERIAMVGNVMIDSLEALRPRAEESDIVERLGLNRGGYIVVTMHRPSNVDDADDLEDLVQILIQAQRIRPVVFPVHPRTRAALEKTSGLAHLQSKGVRMLDPLGYVDFLALQANSAAVLTDSGGIQEETTVLGVPCLTMRLTTERPITVSHGTNQVVGRDLTAIVEALTDVVERPPQPRRPPLWDGHTAIRIVDLLEQRYGHDS